MNVAPSNPGVAASFAPAVLALILQHLAVTLVALSLVRERLSGVMELFRIAPVSALEILVGKILAFGILGSGIAAISVALLVVGFGVPQLADPLALAGTIALLAGRFARARPGDRHRSPIRSARPSSCRCWS